MASQSTGAVGVPLALKLPRVNVQVLFGASPSGAGGGPRKILILGNKTSAGSATVDTEVFAINVDDDAKTKGGSGSEIHLMAKALRKKYPFATLYGIAVTEASGSKAAQTLTITTTATADGNVTVYIHGVPVNVFVRSGDAVGTQATNIAAAISARTEDLCVTASAALGVVTITFKHNGTRGNTTMLRVVNDSTGSTYALGASTLASGTGDDSLTAALATANTSRYHYYVAAHIKQTQLVAIQSQLSTAAGPLVGKRQQAISASTSSLGSTTTIAQALNEPRFQLLWQPNGENLPCQIAAAWAGMRALAESTSISTNLSSMNPDAVDFGDVISAQPSEADWVTDSQANTALDAGITPVQVRGFDRHAYVPLSITTHSLDSNSNPDTRTVCTNMVTVPDAFADEFASWVPSEFPNKTLVPDVEAGDDPRPANSVSPGDIKSKWFARAKAVFDNAQTRHINNLDGDYLSWAFNLVQGNSNRVNCTMPITPAPWFLSVSAQVRQLTQAA